MKVVMERREKQKRAKQSFGGLAPLERPLVLPGGRKWRNAKDAYNEQIIAEIISCTSEVLMGTTIGKVSTP